MVGSKRWFPYTCDSSNGGTVFGLLADESNTEGVNGGQPKLPDPAPKFSLPKNLRPRQVTLKNADGAVKICYVLTEAKYNQISGGASNLISGYTVVNKKAEILTRTISNIDTGQTDGDQEGTDPNPQ